MYSTWSCKYCTLINSDSDVYCASCGLRNSNTSNSLFSRLKQSELLKLPKVSLNRALNVIDSTLVDLGILPGVSRSRRSQSSVSLSRSNVQSHFLPTKVESLVLPIHVVSTSSFQLLQNDEEAAASEYDRIITFCKENNMPFIDDSFPHSKRSIGKFTREGRPDGSILNVDNLIWLRPQNIYTKDGKNYRWSIFLDPKPSDIEQGCLGNCWFLSALAVIAERPDILDQIVLTKNYNPWGIYLIRLCINGHWQVVLVDDFFPCYPQTHGLAFAVGRRNQLWVSLIEKALAKIFGCYAKLPAGRTLEGLAILTGAPCIVIDLESSADYDLVWARLLSMREAGFIMGCSCGGGKRHVDEAEFRSVGLQIRHAYSLLDVKEYKNQRLVRLRNPWGSFTWNGSWCDTWQGWDSYSRRILLPNGPESGAFWMPYSDFIKRFDSVEVAKVRSSEGWKELRVDCCIPQFWGREKVLGFQLQVEESTELAVSVYQKGSRNRCDSDIVVLLHRSGRSGAAIGELIVRSIRHNAAFASTGDVFLKGPALYTVLAISFSNMSYPISIDTVVAVHSAKDVAMEAFRYPPSVIAHSLIEMCLKEGCSTPSLEGTVIRYVTKNFGGHILLIENHHERHYLQVFCDCSQSLNVISTRACLSSVDTIPPMHRQILMLLTHFETTQTYIVHHNLTQRLVLSPGLKDWLSFAPSQVSLPSSIEHVPDLQDPCSSFLHKPRKIG
ncbi:unnamed protein product [Thelazia callipaeda]|uniref:Calpain catalytic domain-containing protein n=1 Tax=Thelazia callipaeda TaxID=103827 RepID=A0A0N5CQ55_THECL|nr:unnamed protein product [Thelazia callipaeda]